MGRHKKTTEQWIAEAKACHDDRYDYSETVYEGSNKKLAIRCKKHGLFHMIAGDFLKGNNCPQCAIESRRVDMADYVERANKVHCGKYTNYRVGKNPRYIIATCPEHGDFEQDKFAHLNGNGCPKCALVKRSNNSKTQEELNLYFIKRAINVHGTKYDYSKSTYVNNTTKLIVTCPEHGDFVISPRDHINGSRGCKYCGIDSNRKRFTFSQDKFEEMARKVHGDKYMYGVYKGMRKKIKIVCPIHGEFSQNAGLHVKGEGCPLCGREEARQGKFYTQEKFLEMAKKIHGERYDYSITVYNGVKNNIQYICHEKDKYGIEHGIVKQNCQSHLYGSGCPKCNRSHLEVLVEKRLMEEGIEYEAQKKFPWLGRQSLDFYLPEFKVAIECQGEQHYRPVEHFGGDSSYEYTRRNDIKKIYKCSSNGVFLYYLAGIDGVSDNKRTFTDIDGIIKSIQMLKTLCDEVGGHMTGNDSFMLGNVLIRLCRSVNYGSCTFKNLYNAYDLSETRVITVFDNEIINHHDIVVEKILNIAGMSKGLKPAYGRNCSIVEIDAKTAKPFFEKNHIQGSSIATIYLAAKLKTEIVAVMSFKRTAAYGNEWEITRFATLSGYRCPGVASKIFQYFVRKETPSQVKSFADRRWSAKGSNMYSRLGFSFDGITDSDYSYIRFGFDPIHKFNFRKKRLTKKFGIPEEMTEREMTEKLGYSRVWNAGLLRYVWRPKRIDTDSPQPSN